MFPHKHFVYGTIFALILILIVPEIGFVGFSLILLSTVLIDVDHYIYYVVRKKDLSLINAYKWFLKNREKFFRLSCKEKLNLYSAWCFFHGIEILIILFILTFCISEYFSFVFMGFAFHLILDYIEQWNYCQEKHKIFIIYDFIKLRKLKHIEKI